MTRRTNARVAGVTFLLYIVAGSLSLVLSSRATSGEGSAAKLVSIAQHATDMRLVVVLSLVASLSALVLGVTLYAITREQDPDLAMLALTCRIVEGVNGAAGIRATLTLLWLATATGVHAPDPAGAQALAASLLRGTAGISAIFFAVGSMLFSWLFLRGHMIPAPLAWLGVVASVLLVAGLPLELAGVLPGSVVTVLWLPMAAFEIPLAFWLIFKGVNAARPR